MKTTFAILTSALGAALVASGCSSVSGAAPALHENASSLVNPSTSIASSADARRHSLVPSRLQDYLPPATFAAGSHPHARVYISSYTYGLIYCYDPNGKQFGLLSGLISPQGEAVTKDARHDLVVADSFGHDVNIYRGACGKALVRSLDDFGGYPTGVATDAHGNIFVTNIFDLSSAPGEVREYAPHDIYGVQIGDPNLSKAYFVAVDANDDVFVDGFDNGSSPAGRVDWLPAGSKTWRNTGIPLIFPGGIDVDAQGNILVRDQDAGFAAYTVPDFKPARAHFACPNPLGCDDFSFTADGTEIWTADARLGVAYDLRYPSGATRREIQDVGGGGSGPTIIDAQIIPGS
jgi:hypothetical protein